MKKGKMLLAVVAASALLIPALLMAADAPVVRTVKRPVTLKPSPTMNLHTILTPIAMENLTHKCEGGSMSSALKMVRANLKSVNYSGQVKPQVSYIGEDGKTLVAYGAIVSLSPGASAQIAVTLPNVFIRSFTLFVYGGTTLQTILADQKIDSPWAQCVL